MVSAEAFVAVRERFGGPGPAALGAALAGYRAALDAFVERSGAIAARQAAAHATLELRMHEIAQG